MALSECFKRSSGLFPRDLGMKSHIQVQGLALPTPWISDPGVLGWEEPWEIGRVRLGVEPGLDKAEL